MNLTGTSSADDLIHEIETNFTAFLEGKRFNNFKGEMARLIKLSDEELGISMFDDMARLVSSDSVVVKYSVLVKLILTLLELDTRTKIEKDIQETKSYGLSFPE